MFAGPNSGEGVTAAKEYVAREGLTQDVAKIARDGEDIIVILKKDIAWPPPERI